MRIIKNVPLNEFDIKFIVVVIYGGDYRVSATFLLPHKRTQSMYIIHRALGFRISLNRVS
jgi:hypothetical protein